tara:strand:- start:2271 stop:2492 length:222 start_codon:yes stop_codon:yes gene_type:complete
MGKGDRKTKRGKIHLGTYGARRKRNKSKILENHGSAEKDAKAATNTIAKTAKKESKPTKAKSKSKAKVKDEEE